MEQQQPSAEYNPHNMTPEDISLVAPVVRGQEEVNAKDRLVLGFWRDAIDAEFPNQGFEYLADPLTDHLDERFERIKLDAVLTRRSRLESSSLFRHPIPYILIHRYNEAKGCIEFFIYQRTKAVGEQLLAGNHSLAGGGHPEANQMCFYPNMSLNVKESLLAVAVTELDEEFEFNGLSFSDLAKTTPITFTHDGFIRDDMNEVGKQHLGVVYSVGIPPHIDVVCKEAELITVGFRSLEEILSPDSGFNFERWSYMIADHLHRLIEEERAKAAARGPVEEPVDEAAEYRARAERLAKLPPVELTLERANAFQETSGFDLLSWELGEGEKVVTREDNVFLDGVIEHPMEGRKVVVIALDDHDPDPVTTVALIKAELLKGWDALKGDPVVEEGYGRELGLMDGDLPEEPLETGEDGCELEQEEDGDIPDSGEDPEEPADEEVRQVESVVRRADGGLLVNVGSKLTPELQARAEAAHEATLAERPVGSAGESFNTPATYPRGGRPEFAHIDEASFRHVEPEPQRYDPAPHRDADVGGYGDSGGSSSSSDSGSSSND
ncbi:hypothetical protein [Streptomyces sp. CHB9.2]|uniref:hypothetical protein n=1 Tax=Streptomyces sp. CHB9.2 TaxID=2841670 RepID=UPI0020943059|nr:hypothetical protein [Streptomyces sp. CHB9.2]MCO6704755.1 hypothetical protein [Streptomyces sp. CHB9.2]